MKEKKEIEMPKPNKVPASITLAPQVKEKAEALADQDGRSLSNYIERLILDDIIRKK